MNEDALCETVSKVMDTLLWDRVNEETKRILESITLGGIQNEFCVSMRPSRICIISNRKESTHL